MCQRFGWDIDDVTFLRERLQLVQTGNTCRTAKSGIAGEENVCLLYRQENIFWKSNGPETDRLEFFDPSAVALLAAPSSTRKIRISGLAKSKLMVTGQLALEERFAGIQKEKVVATDMARVAQINDGNRYVMK